MLVSRTILLRWYYWPIIAAVMIVIYAFVIYRPDGIWTLGKIELREGGVNQATLSPPYTGNFIVGVRMGEAEAKALAPCLANDEKFSQPECTRTTPLRIAFRLEGEKSDPATLIVEGVGGSYDGKHFLWYGPFVSLRKDMTYTVATRTMTAVPNLNEAHPELVLWDSRAGIGEEAGLNRIAASVIAFFLIVVGLIGLTIARRTRRSAAE